MNNELVQVLGQLLDEKLKPIEVKLLQRVDEKFKPIEEKLEQIEQRFRPIEDRLERIETKLDATFQQTGKNAEGIVKIEHRVDDLSLTMRIMNRQNADTQLEVLKLKEKVEPDNEPHVEYP